MWDFGRRGREGYLNKVYTGSQAGTRGERVPELLRWAHTWPHQARDGLFDRNPYASTNKEGGEKHNTGSHDVGLANDLLAGPPQRMYVAARGAVATDPHPGAAYRDKMWETSPDNPQSDTQAEQETCRG